MNTVSAGKSDIGRIRANNEDSFLIEEALELYAVADGMGGHAGGGTASRMAVACVQQTVREAARKRTNTGSSHQLSAVQVLAQAFLEANRAVLEAASRDVSLRGMGTTMTALMLEASQVHIAHVGDSRAYRYRSGRLEQLTQDHSLVAEQVRAGLISPEAARSSPYRHVISRAVGIDLGMQPDTITLNSAGGDIYLLVTDGLTEMATDEEIGRIVEKTPVPHIPEKLIEHANERGGVDNITVVAVNVAESAETGKEAPVNRRQEGSPG